MPECDFLDELQHVFVSQDIDVHSWYMTITFLVLFLIAVIYGVSATFIQVRRDTSYGNLESSIWYLNLVSTKLEPDSNIFLVVLVSFPPLDKIMVTAAQLPVMYSTFMDINPLLVFLFNSSMKLKCMCKELVLQLGSQC